MVQSATPTQSEFVAEEFETSVTEESTTHLAQKIEEIVRSAVWVTGTQLVCFSTGANRMIRDDLDKETADRLDTESVLILNPSFDPEKHATPESYVNPFEVVNTGWSIEGVCRVIETGETAYEMNRNASRYQTIGGVEHIDPQSNCHLTVPNYRPIQRFSEITVTTI